jgi:hypothetical protein
MKWLLSALGIIVGLVVVVYVVGALLPRDHVATVRVRLSQPPERIYATLADVSAAPSWRDDVQKVEVLSVADEPLRWRETGKYGTMAYVRDEDWPGRRLVGRIADTAQGFGGRWEYDIRPVDGGTALTITERGEVYNPMFRFVSRFVFGHYSTLEGYVRSLGRHFGEDVSIERVTT